MAITNSVTSNALSSIAPIKPQIQSKPPVTVTATARREDSVVLSPQAQAAFSGTAVRDNAGDAR